MDPRQKAIQQAMQSNSDPTLIAALRDYQTTGKPPTDPRVVAVLNQAFQANGVPPLPSPNGPFATAAGDPNNKAANQQAQAQVAAVTPAQASGGVDPGREENRTAATPAPGAGLPSSPPAQAPAMPGTGAGGQSSPPPTSGPLDQGNLQNVTLTGDQNFAFEKMMTMLGIGPGNRGAFGTSIGKTLLPMFQAYLGLGGLQGDAPGNMMDNASKSVDGFAGLVGGAKGLMGQLQDYGNSTIGNISKYGDKLSDPHEQQRYMDMATALSTAGDNPLIRQAMADENTRAQYGFDEAAYNGLGTPTGPKNYIKWLQDQAGQAGGAGYSDIIRLFGGA